MGNEPMFAALHVVGAFCAGMGFAVAVDAWGRARLERQREKARRNPDHHKPPRSVNPPAPFPHETWERDRAEQQRIRAERRVKGDEPPAAPQETQA